MPLSARDGYSSRVDILLRVNGTELSVAKVGPDSLMLAEPQAIPPSTNAEIVVKVDNTVETRSICLFEGASPDHGRVRFF